MADQRPSRLVVFDFDGTLADTWRDIATALNQTLADAGLPAVGGPDVRFWIGEGAMKLLERAVPEEERDADKLAALFERASNKPTRFLPRVIDGLGLKGYFRIVLGGDTLDVQKPDPRVLAHLIAQLETRPDQVWMVGDSAIDIETGRNSGARTIGCAWGLRGRDELRDARPDFLVESPREIPPLVLGAR